MDLIQYNGRQLSMFDYEKEKISREAFIRRIDLKLGLKPTPRFKTMVEACTENPALFNEKQRRFLRQCAIAVFDGKEMTSAQYDYLVSLFYRTTN